MNRLQEKYVKEVKDALMKKHNYSSVMQCPKVVKVVINLGVGEATQEPKALEEAVADLTALAGQNQLLQKLRNQSLTSN